MISFKGFAISWHKKATKQLEDLEKSTQERIIDRIDLLTSKSDQLDIKKLQGYSDLYRIGIGDYRVILKVLSPSRIIIIAFIAHRRDIYKKFQGI